MRLTMPVAIGLGIGAFYASFIVAGWIALRNATPAPDGPDDFDLWCAELDAEHDAEHDARDTRTAADRAMPESPAN